MSEHLFLGDRVEGALLGLHDIERTTQQHVYVSRRQSSKLTRGGRMVTVENPEYRRAFTEAVQTFNEVAQGKDFNWKQVVAGIVRFRAYDPGIQPRTIPSSSIKTFSPESVKQRMRRVEMLRHTGTPFIFNFYNQGDIFGVSLGDSVIETPQADTAKNGLPNASIALRARTIGFLGGGEGIVDTTALDVFSNFTVGKAAIEEHWKQERNTHNSHSVGPDHINTLWMLEREARIFSMLGVDLDTSPIEDIARRHING